MAANKTYNQNLSCFSFIDYLSSEFDQQKLKDMNKFFEKYIEKDANRVNICKLIFGFMYSEIKKTPVSFNYVDNDTFSGIQKQLLDFANLEPF